MPETLLSHMRADAELIFRAGLRAADPAAAVHRTCHMQNGLFIIGDQRIDPATVRRIFVVGAGKASAAMAQALEQILGERIQRGLISVKHRPTAPLQRIELIETGHPLPDRGSVTAAGRILDLVHQARADDLVIGLFSGGGSALLSLPAAGIPLADKQHTTDLLLASGATIHEINSVRKHLSAIKGGRLAQAAAPARLITLILSDVVGDDLQVIASGPTVPDTTTFGDCLDIVRRYGLARKLPPTVCAHLQAGAAGRQAETPKADTCGWDHARNLIIGNNHAALQAAAAEARRRGYTPLILSSRIQGETRTVAGVHCAIAQQVALSGEPLKAPACLLSGGETTVTLTDAGRGGRNQEFALAAALCIAEQPHILILSAGTDGTDGPTDAAGAFADHTTARRAGAAGLDPRHHLDHHDAYPFFENRGDLLTTGPTGTNVMDINVILVRV